MDVFYMLVFCVLNFRNCGCRGCLGPEICVEGDYVLDSVLQTESSKPINLHTGYVWTTQTLPYMQMVFVSAW